MSSKKPLRPEPRLEPLLGLGFPDPPKITASNFPMKFRAVLREFIGGRLHDERLHLFRKYLRHMFSAEGCSENRADKRATAVIANLKKNGLNDPEVFFKHLRNIADWRKQNRIQQRREAAKSRWAKNTQKSVDPSPGFQKE